MKAALKEGLTALKWVERSEARTVAKKVEQKAKKSVELTETMLAAQKVAK